MTLSIYNNNIKKKIVDMIPISKKTCTFNIAFKTNESYYFGTLTLRFSYICIHLQGYWIDKQVTCLLKVYMQSESSMVMNLT